MRDELHDEIDPDCTCQHPFGNDPDRSYRLNPHCPVHGRDPDEAYDRMRDERAERMGAW